MLYDKFIKPKEIKVKERVFTVSKIPATEAQPIYSSVAKSITDNGAVGMTMLPTATVRDILTYVAIEDGDDHFVLDTDNRVDRYFIEQYDLHAVIIEMIKYNFSFLINGDLLDLLADKAEATDSAS